MNTLKRLGKLGIVLSLATLGTMIFTNSIASAQTAKISNNNQNYGQLVYSRTVAEGLVSKVSIEDFTNKKTIWDTTYTPGNELDDKTLSDSIAKYNTWYGPDKATQDSIWINTMIAVTRASKPGTMKTTETNSTYVEPNKKQPAETSVASKYATLMPAPNNANQGGYNQFSYRLLECNGFVSSLSINNNNGAMWDTTYSLGNGPDYTLLNNELVAYKSLVDSIKQIYPSYDPSRAIQIESIKSIVRSAQPKPNTIYVGAVNSKSYKTSTNPDSSTTAKSYSHTVFW